MTYLHQLRAHFTGHQLEVQQIGKTVEESNYVIGKFNTDKDTDITKQVFGQEIISLRKAKQNKKQENPKDAEMNLANNKDSSGEQKGDASKLRLQLKITTEPEPLKDSKEKSPTTVKDVKDIILNSSKTIMNKVKFLVMAFYSYSSSSSMVPPILNVSLLHALPCLPIYSLSYPVFAFYFLNIF